MIKAAYEWRQKGEWIPHEGKHVPQGIRDDLLVEVIYHDGSRCTSNDFMHTDLWKPENPRISNGGKDIALWRTL